MAINAGNRAAPRLPTPPPEFCNKLEIELKHKAEFQKPAIAKWFWGELSIYGKEEGPVLALLIVMAVRRGKLSAMWGNGFGVTVFVDIELSCKVSPAYSGCHRIFLTFG